MKNIINTQGITSDIIKNKYSMHSVYMILTKPETELIPRGLKAILLVSVFWMISLYTIVNGYIFLVFSSIISIVALVFYFKSFNFFKKASYSIIKYISIQSMVIFYISSIQFTQSHRLNSIIACVYILVSYMFSFYIAYQKVLVEFYEQYFPEKKPLKILNIKKIIKLIGIVGVGVLVFMQLYRINKWWIEGSDLDFLSGMNGTLLGTIVSIVAVTLALVLLMLVTIIPILCLKSKDVLDGLLLKQFSEELRTEYEYSKKNGIRSSYLK